MRYCYRDAGDVDHSSGAWSHKLQQERLADELHEKNQHEQGENQVLSHQSYIFNVQILICDP